MRVAYLVVAILAGCSSNDVIAQLDEDSSPPVEDAAVETAAPADAGDSATPDASADGADSSAPDTKPPADTATPPVDTGPADIGTTFPCGAERCGGSLQFCRRATAPGICPAIDSGICPAGCPGCAPLSLTCENLPTKCWAKPSCSCILVEVCGSVAAGDCVEKDGGFVAGCRGV